MVEKVHGTDTWSGTVQTKIFFNYYSLNSLLMLFFMFFYHSFLLIFISPFRLLFLSLSPSLSLYICILYLIIYTIFTLTLFVYYSLSKQNVSFFLTFSFFLRYFQQEPNTSMRRCEELPWHLQLCRKWGPLKDTIADLKTFEMMYSRYVIVLQFN